MTAESFVDREFKSTGTLCDCRNRSGLARTSQPGPVSQAGPGPAGYEARGNVSGTPMMVRSLSTSRDSNRDTCI